MDLRGSVCGSRPTFCVWIYSEEVYVDLGCGSCVDFLRGSLCGSTLS
jgi:hypothetical protein